ncbi:phosphatase PAP2 family protein [Cytobacillus sp. Hz8]|uniref:phosphatase PAP2 family protein n=1 Tax=Cytobacillus sp. Hz8 TaxID=3347168 RepID=UPI0035DC68C5
MNLKFRLSIAFLLSVLFLIGFSSIAIWVSASDIIQFDRHIIAFVQGFETPILTKIMKFFTFIGSTTPVIVISFFVIIFLYTVLKHRRELVFFIGGLMGSVLLNHFLKVYFHRARPAFHRLIEIGGYSFPSGHAMSAFMVYGMITYLLWRHISNRFGRIFLVIFSSCMIIGIGLSRIYLGVHYPTDILGGYLASGCWLAICIWVFERYR